MTRLNLIRNKIILLIGFFLLLVSILFTIQIFKNQSIASIDGSSDANVTNEINSNDMIAGPKRKKNAVVTPPTVSTTTSPTSTVPVNSTTTSSEVTNLPIVTNGYSGKVMAWIYPGKPACSAAAEIADGRGVHTLKAEYFTINGGSLRRIDAINYCNGYSADNVALLRANSVEQYVTISSASAADMAVFLSDTNSRQTAVKTLSAFIVSNNLTGIELDFEDFGGWTSVSYANFKTFVTELGNELRVNNKKLMIDGPAVSNTTEQNWYVWRYADFVNLPVDYMVIMTYDYQFDHGAGEPVAPLDWMKASLEFISRQFPKERMVAGIPSYGYQGTIGTYRATIMTSDQMRTVPGFSSATRDARSAEMTWKSGTQVYFFQDATSMNAKAAVAREVGIPAVSVWHLGGNPWF